VGEGEGGGEGSRSIAWRVEEAGKEVTAAVVPDSGAGSKRVTKLSPVTVFRKAVACLDTLHRIGNRIAQPHVNGTNLPLSDPHSCF
jgi:hypothetical protein